MAARLKLPQVTICSADSAYVDLTARALERSMELCDFGDAILFSDLSVAGSFRHVPIAPLNSVQDYSDFCLKGLPRQIETPFVLVIQWDGFVVNPGAWRNIFLRQDYIGATWHNLGPNQRVGNGGFSLRSQKLLQALTNLPLVPGHWEDAVICRLYRPRLEDEFGIKFASEKIADQFSYEFEPRDSFGFHGFHNLWRYLEDAELFDLVMSLWQRRIDIWKAAKLLTDTHAAGRTKVANDLYAELRLRHSYAEVVKAAEGIPRLPSTFQSLTELERHLSTSPVRA